MSVIGNIIVYWIIFRLLIIVRMPYKLDESISLLQIYLILGIIAGSLIEIKILRNKLSDKKRISRIQEILQKYVDKYYVQPLVAFQKVILDIPRVSKFIAYVKRPFSTLLNHQKALKYITFYLYFYARFFLIISLSIDVFYLHQVLVFYKMLYLLILPLTCNAFLSMIHEHSTNILRDLEIKQVSIIYEDSSYHIKIKNITLSHQIQASILDECQINLKTLNVISNINAFKNSAVFTYIQLIFAILFCFLWTYGVLHVILDIILYIEL